MTALFTTENTFIIDGKLHRRPSHLDPLPRPPHQQHYGLVKSFALNRGSIKDALSSPDHMVSIWPESPRPGFMLTHGRFSDHLTVKDIILFEIMLTWSRANGCVDRPHAIPVNHLLTVLGWTGNKRYLAASVDRLRRATYKVRYSNSKNLARSYRFSADGEFPLIDPQTHIAFADPKTHADFEVRGDHLLFKIGEKMREFQLCRLRYHYVEISAMAKMESKYSLRLYQHLVYQTWNPAIDTRPGMPGSVTGYPFSINPKKLARRIGWLRRGQDFNFAAFKREVLDRAMVDLANVRALSTSYSIERGPGRGNPVATITFSLVPSVPDWRRLKSTSMADLPAEEADQLTQPDNPKLKPKVAVFLRAAHYWRTSAASLHRAWQIALYEALNKIPVNDGYEVRQTRGERLLSALAERDPSDVAWDFIKEEMNTPSLLAHIEANWGSLASAANGERAGSLGLKKISKSARTLAEARAACFAKMEAKVRAEANDNAEQAKQSRDEARSLQEEIASMSEEEYELELEKAIANAMSDAGFDMSSEPDDYAITMDDIADILSGN